MHSSEIERITAEPLSEMDRAQKIRDFDQIMLHFEFSQSTVQIQGSFKPITMLRFMREEKRGLDLVNVMSRLDCNVSSRSTAVLEQSLITLGGDILDIFFCPVCYFGRLTVPYLFEAVRALAGKTLQFSPESAEFIDQDEVMGTSRRDSTLRESCLIRDCHRCVITRMFDINVVRKHQGEGPIIDYHGNELLPGDLNVGPLKVAHIIPHSLLSFRNVSGAEPRLPEPKRFALQILKMFNPVAVQ
ncbi:hypothetical protein V1514DRAFT_318355 [Lipomyces japonicus]|uniref:uncharacterized protein n=1 Tax=Lipomyces japonicus TaxID=56871 RepID=UPI0034CFFAC7